MKTGLIGSRRASAFVFASFLLTVSLLAGCGSAGGVLPAVDGALVADGVVVWNEQAPAGELPSVVYPSASVADEPAGPVFNPRDVDAASADGYAASEGDEYHYGDIPFGSLQANGAAGVLNGSVLAVGLNDFGETFGGDGWVIDEAATDAASMSVIYGNERYPGAVLTLDDGFFDAAEGLPSRIQNTGFRGYSLDFVKTGDSARPDMRWMGGVTFGSSIEEVSGVYLPTCGQEYYSYDGADYSIRAYQLSENYCVWFGFYGADGLQFVSLRIW